MRRPPLRLDDAPPALAARVAGPTAGKRAARPGRGRGILAGAAIVVALAVIAGGARPAAGQAPRTDARALRVGATLPVRELVHDSLRVVSLGAVPALGLALLPAHGPLQRLLLDAAPAMLRVDPGSGCTQLNGYACASEAAYGLTVSAVAETGTRARLSRALLAYGTIGPAARLYAFRSDFSCVPQAILCSAADRYGRGGIGLGGHAALGLRRVGHERHLSTEAAATVFTFPGARTQLDLGLTVSFPF